MISPASERSSQIQIQHLHGGQFRLTGTQWFPQSIETVFEFFADAANLQKITPDWLSFRIVTETPIDMHEGVLIDYRLHLHGLPIRWRTEIAEWNPPHQFVDQMLKGPYSKWHHEHRFESVDGGTRVTDVVHYAVPGGRIIHKLFVRRDLERIFGYRQQVLAEMFAAETAEAAT